MGPTTIFPFLLRISEISKGALWDRLHPLLRGEAEAGRILGGEGHSRVTEGGLASPRSVWFPPPALKILGI